MISISGLDDSILETSTTCSCMDRVIEPTDGDHIQRSSPETIMWIRPSSIYKWHSCGRILCYRTTGFHQRSNWSVHFMHKNKDGHERRLHTQKDAQNTLRTGRSSGNSSKQGSHVYCHL